MARMQLKGGASCFMPLISRRTSRRAAHRPCVPWRFVLAAFSLVMCGVQPVVGQGAPAWDENWQVTFPVNQGPGRAAFGATSANNGDINDTGQNHAIAKAEVIIDTLPFGADGGVHMVSFSRKFTLLAGGPYGVELTTSLTGDISIIDAKNGSAAIDALVVVAPVGQAAILTMRTNAHKRYWTVLPRDGTSFASPAGGWNAFGGTGFVMAPGQYEIRGSLSAQGLTTNGSIGVDTASRFFTTGLRVDVVVRQPALLVQPVAERSSIVCHPDAAAPARSLARKGIYYDFEFASAMNTAMTDGMGQPKFDNLNFQFNQCFSGGMIDDLFSNLAPTINGAANKVSASSAAQHNEQSFSLITCKGGMAWGRHFTWAVWHGAVTPAFPMGKAAWYALRNDQCGPISGPCAGKTEHPQYKSNGNQADNFVIGTHATRRALVFMGNTAGRNDYFNDIRNIRISLNAAGYADANNQYFGGPGFAANADPCLFVPVAIGAATRGNLQAAIAALPGGGAGTKEYYAWIGDHGQRWKFTLLNFVGIGNPVVLPPVNLLAPPQGGRGPGPVYEDSFSLDQDFIDVLLDESLIYIECEAVAPHPVRVMVNGVIVFDPNRDATELLNPGDTVFEIPSGLLQVGVNTISVENLSEVDPVTLTAVGAGTDAVETVAEMPPGDLNGDLVVDQLDLDILMAAFGSSRDDSEGQADMRFNAVADFDRDLAITFVDLQHWLELLNEFENPE